MVTFPGLAWLGVPLTKLFNIFRSPIFACRRRCFSLVSVGRSKGILLVAIEHSIPLIEQGPFDVLLHKVSGLQINVNFS